MDNWGTDRLLPTKRWCVGLFKVALRETITIPPLSEAIVAAEAHDAPTYTCALVEPCLSFMSRKHV